MNRYCILGISGGTDLDMYKTCYLPGNETATNQFILMILIK